MSKKIYTVFGLLIAISMILAACAQPTAETIIETVVVEKEGKTVVETVIVEVEGETVVETVVVEVEVTPKPVDRKGGWLDTIIMVEEPSFNNAVIRLEVGDLDVFAHAVNEPDIAQMIYDSEVLGYETSYGGSNELTFMPSTEKEFKDGRLNPFFSEKIREAMNWLVDRDYIVEEMSGGLARPKFVPVNFASRDSALLADTIAAIELKYAHNPEKAVEIITVEMEALGAEMVDGKWNYNGDPVVLIGLIRSEDERLEIGDYVSNLLEDIGFTVERDYKTAAEASTCWVRSDPDEGCMHFYTGGWVSTAISRDDAGSFSFYYTPDGPPLPPWQAYNPSPEFLDVARALSKSEFTTMEEREGLMAEALNHALENSQRIWLKDDVGVAPHAANISVASDLSGSIAGSRLWALTLRFDDKVGGSMTIALPGRMTGDWNPVNGGGGIYNAMPVRGMQSGAVVPDPFTGVNVPLRLASAEVQVQTGLPVSQNYEWAPLEFVDEITVPEDAWYDWDAENQVFITVGEAFTETQTALSKVTMSYEDDMFEKVKWHDGSPLTLADFIMMMIMGFDQAKETSPIYDEAQVSTFETWHDPFKGWKIASEDPLVIEFYTDAYQLDAENNITNFRAASPSGYFKGEASWHGLVPGWRVEANGAAAFSADKADANQVEQMSFIAGPTIELMKAQLDSAQEEGYIPYEPTLGQYITAEEVAERYENLQEWYRRYGHFWVNTGPYFLQKAFPVEGTLILQHNPDYPDMADRWTQFATAPIPVVELDGPGNVAIGSEAKYDVFVSLGEEPYPTNDISICKFLVFDAVGELAHVGECEAVESGRYAVVLTSDITGALEAGSNQLAVVVVSSRALVPVRETLQFVTQ
jgi:peptide/nickel transport system substrate-binding protein